MSKRNEKTVDIPADGMRFTVSGNEDDNMYITVGPLNGWVPTQKQCEHIVNTLKSMVPAMMRGRYIDASELRVVS